MLAAWGIERLRKRNGIIWCFFFFDVKCVARCWGHLAGDLEVFCNGNVNKDGGNGGWNGFWVVITDGAEICQAEVESWMEMDW